MATYFRPILSALVRSPLAWIIALLLPFALGNPTFRASVVLATYATIFATGSVVLVGISLYFARLILADILRGYRGPSLPSAWDMLVVVGDWQARQIWRAIDGLASILPGANADRLACPTCPFGECEQCEPVQPVFTPALAVDLDTVYARFAGIRPAPVPVASIFSPCPSFVPARAPLARLLPSWEERAACERIPTPVVLEGRRIALPMASLRPASIDPIDADFEWHRANEVRMVYDPPARLQDVRFVPVSEGWTSRLAFTPPAIAPLPRVLPDAISDPCDETDHGEHMALVGPSSRRWDALSSCWTAEPEREHCTIAACGPVAIDLPRLPDVRDGEDAPLPSDADLDTLAFTPEDNDDCPLSGQEGARPEAPSVAQDRPEASEPTVAPSDGLDGLGRDKLRTRAKLVGMPLSGKWGADTIRAALRKWLDFGHDSREANRKGWTGRAH